VIRGVVKRVTK